MKILFYGGIGWGFSQDMYDYVFKLMGARQHKPEMGVDLEYMLDVMFNDYDLIWCEGGVSRRACFLHFLFQSRVTGPLNRFYRSDKAKIISRFHFHDVKPFLQRWKWQAVMALTSSDQAVCVSEYWRRELMRLLPSIKNIFDIRDIKIVHNGIHTSKYVPNPSLKENNTIFYLAVTNMRKRLHLLIQAMKYLKDWKLVIGGKCSEFEEAEKGEDPTIPLEYRSNRAYWRWCHKLSDSYKNRVEWTGFLLDEDKIKMYQRATIFCLPSRVESWGVAAMEAMACGTPAIATNVGGLPEFVPQQQLLSTMPTPKKIAEKILEVSHHPEWNELNRKIAQAYDWKEIGKEVQEVINEVVITE